MHSTADAFDCRSPCDASRRTVHTPYPLDAREHGRLIGAEDDGCGLQICGVAAGNTGGALRSNGDAKGPAAPGRKSATDERRNSEQGSDSATSAGTTA